MVSTYNNKTLKWIDRHRYFLLLVATLMVLILPPFSGGGPVSEILFWLSLTFLFIQSMIAANLKKAWKIVIRAIVIIMILLTWLQPIGIESKSVTILKNASFALFFIFIVYYLLKFIRTSSKVNSNVLITSVNIYLLLGIIWGSLAALLNKIYPDAYNVPDHLISSTNLHLFYYSFITMTTVGYGDITPQIPQTQTLAYLMAITGQLYVAIIIAFLVGKLLVSQDRGNRKEEEAD